MDIDFFNVDKTLKEVDVKIALAEVLHNPPFRDKDDLTPLLNFDVKLEMQRQDPRYHTGRGRLTIANKDVAQQFVELYTTPAQRNAYGRHQNGRVPNGNWRGKSNGKWGSESHVGARSPSFVDTTDEVKCVLHLAGKTLRFEKFSDRPMPRRVEELNTLPFVDPQAEFEEKLLEKDIGDSTPFHALQFGRRIWNEDGRLSHTFSTEWEVLLSSQDGPEVGFNVRQRNVEVRFSKTRYPDSIMYAVVFPWSRVLSLLWDDGTMSRQYSAIFHLEVPPSFERLPDRRDGRGVRLKLNFISFHDDCTHEPLAPYISNTMRIVFQDRTSLIQFRDAAKRAFGFAVKPRFTTLTSEHLNRFDKLQDVDDWLGTLDLRVALQCAALYMNGYLDPYELLALRPEIELLIATHEGEEDLLATLLSVFAAKLRNIQYAAVSMRSGPQVQPIPISTLLKQVTAEDITETKLRPAKGGMIRACAAIVTPTSMHLEGPYMDQSNSVLRMHGEYHHHFLRLKFTDENHLPLYSDPNVDSRLFVRYRIGTTLRPGIKIAGRHFEFLAYSLSALRQHSVWMVTPFKHPQFGPVTAQSIRDRLGDFSKVSNCPAKYGARLAQAFTATEPSIILKPENIVEVNDKVHKSSGAIFTDGVGMMSLPVHEKVWDQLTRNRPHYRAKMPFPATVFQFRLGGFKGLLSLNPMLPGTQIHVRPSMNKFDAPDSLGLEIAKSFERPRPFFLNRPFVMLLESRGIPGDVFLTLQRNAIKDIEDATTSLVKASRMAETWGLGGTFKIKYILKNLYAVLGLDFQPAKDRTSFSEPFLQHLLQVGKANALREIRFRARVPVPDSWTLIGVADEHNVLKRNEIYACIQHPTDAEPYWISGPAIVTKSPSLGPGDAQMVTAIGKPPDDSPFMMGPFPLKNCVVFSCRGQRSLPSMLGGGDLDGDEFNVVQYKYLFPKEGADPDDFNPAPRTELDRDCTIDDVVDFVIQYINNDLVGRLATEHLVLADQHSDGVNYANCHQLAQLYALALDFMKTGTPIDMDAIPKPLNDMKPDYLQREQQVIHRSTKFYPSQRALGRMYREPELQVDMEAVKNEMNGSVEGCDGSDLDILHTRIKDFVNAYIPLTGTSTSSSTLFNRYAEELRHICSTTSAGRLGDEAGEGEAVMGVILSKTVHPKVRLDRVHRLRIQMADLVGSVRDEFMGQETDSFQQQLTRAFDAWSHARSQCTTFGARSFQLIALGSIFELIEDHSSKTVNGKLADQLKAMHI